MRRLASVTSALFVSLALIGCTPQAAPTPTASPTQTQTQEPEPEPVYIAAPLTGVSYLEGTNAYLSLPAVSAKVDNTSPGRPQLELNRADVVYVTRVEGGMTRLLAVWHSDMPEAIGPVRSVRPVDAAVAHPYGGVFIYSGGQAPFKNAARDTGLVMGDEDTFNGKELYYREGSRVAPWNLFFSAQKIQTTYSDQAAPQNFFEFDAVPSAVSLGTAMTGISVKYPGTHSEWALGEASFPWAASAEPAWLRTQDGSIHAEFPSGDQVRAKNVVVLEVEHDNSFIDPKYGAIPKAMLVDNSGVAHIFSEGFYLKAKWSKASSNSVIVLTTDSGEPVKLAIGNTWVEMQDVAKSKLTITGLPEPEAETTDE